ncbi:MAG: O-antigen ligase family protein [Flavobacteriales bacterium]|jgi:O-antigen ligase|nr:O-antigen ligase family protein [Flavobacteriales bacterium]
MPISWNKLKDKANYYLILFIAFFIPLKKEAIAPLIILFFISSLWNKRPHLRLNINWRVFIIIGFYFFGILSLFYGKNTSNTWFNNEIKLSLFVFPVAFLISNLDFKSIYRSILKSFVEGTLMAIMLSLINAIIRYYYERESTVFFYSELSYFAHTSYFSLYLNFAISILYFFWFSPSKKNYIPPYLNFGLSFFFSLTILLLASKTGVITMLITHLIGIGFWVIRYRKFKQAAILLGALSILISVGLYQSPQVVNRLITMKDSILNYNGTPNSSSTVRLAVWSEAIELIKAKPILGYGVGDVTDELTKRYEERGFSVLAKKHLNSHNQYIQILIGSGVIGLFYFLFLIIYPFKSIGKPVDLLIYLFFFLLILINFLTESMLETQSGVVFFAFFITLFYSLASEQKQIHKI